MLRREGYEEPITMISADDSAPYDRPSLSKEYLAGQAQEEWIPLRSPDYYSGRKIDLVLKSRVSAIDVNASTIDRCFEYSRVDSIPSHSMFRGRPTFIDNSLAIRLSAITASQARVRAWTRRWGDTPQRSSVFVG